MRLRTLAGASAGEIRDYDGAAGLAALRTGMAEHVEPSPTPTSAVTPEPVSPRVSAMSSRRGRRAAGTTKA